MVKQGIFRSLFKSKKQATSQTDSAQNDLAHLGRVVPDASRCVQCGICGYNCPVGIQVRDYAHRGLPVDDPTCITCGNCINVCPRGTLRWETQAHSLLSAKIELELKREAVSSSSSSSRSS